METVKMKDGKIELVMTERDMEYLIEKYMGYDFLRCYRNRIGQYKEALSEIKKFVAESNDEETVGLGVSLIEDYEKELE